MGKIISVCNQKGGTGKTTSAINISTYLALAEKRVLVIDFDPQGNATSGLGIDKNGIEKSIYEVLLGEVSLEEVINSTEISNLYLVPSNLNLTGAEIELVGFKEREFCLKRAIAPIRENFDFIFIDCPPSLGLLTINALVSSDSVFIPVQCEYYALEGLTSLLKTIQLVKENLNPQLEIGGIILTMADFRTNLTEEVISETRMFFSQGDSQGLWKGEVKVYSTVIPRNIKLSEAPSFGKPIAFYDRDSIGAKRYWELSQEILEVPVFQ